jgi:acyl-CoA dehydrogenase
MSTDRHRLPRPQQDKMQDKMPDEIEAAIGKICAPFDDAYWRARDTDGEFPAELHAALARDGWLGIAIPEADGGSGLGVTEAAIMMQTIAQSGAGFSGASAVHMNIFGLTPVVLFGSAEQKQRHLPPLIAGREKACFAVTEPDAGLDTSRITTQAVRDGDRYLVSGKKIWISTAQVADKVLLLARTSPRPSVGKPTDGLSLFYAPLDRTHVEIREIDKLGRAAVDSNQLFFDNMPIAADNLIGDEGKGFDYILHGMNPERILIGAEAIGLGRAALARAATYAKERVVFNRPIGANQGIQHPLARAWMALEAANLMVFKAAALFDAGQPCGVEANAAKYLGGEAGYQACETAVMTHGGMGYAKDFHVERYLREAMLARLVPVSRELILNHIAERALGLPKSY